VGGAAVPAGITQVFDTLGIFDAYSYDHGGDDVDIYSQFAFGGTEEQANIFEDYVTA
jgi:hypothetical protein